MTTVWQKMLICVFFISIASIVNTQAQTPATNNNNALDILFMIDCSYYVTEDYFSLLRTAVLNFVETFPLGINLVNVAVISYSSVISRINFTADIQLLRRDIPNLFYDGQSARTHLAFDEALIMMTSQQSRRPQTRKVVILVTASMSLFPAESRKSAEKLRNAGVLVYCVGIGPNVRYLELIDFTANLPRTFIWNRYDVLPAIDLGLTAVHAQTPSTSMETLTQFPLQTSSPVFLPSDSLSTSATTATPSISMTPTAAYSTSLTLTVTYSTSLTPTPTEYAFPSSSVIIQDSCYNTNWNNTNGDDNSTGPGDGSVIFNSTNDGICSQAVSLGGFGFAPHPRDCDKFLQCHRSEAGTVTASVRFCPRGLFWKQTSLTCVQPDQTCCSDLCDGKCEGQTYRMDGGCGFYYECRGGVSTARRCLPYRAYIPGSGCVLSPACVNMDKQAGNCPDSDCPLVKIFNITSNELTNFSANNKTMIPVDECKRNGASTGQTYRTVCTINKSGIISPPADSTRAVTLQFRYLTSTSRSPSSKSEVLVCSAGCVQEEEIDGLFVVAEEDASLYVKVVSPAGYVLSASLSLLGLNQTEWRDVYIQYFRGNLFLELTSGNLVYNIYTKGGLHVPVGACGWKVGVPEQLTDHLAQFTGNISEVLISRCNEFGF